MRQAPVLLTVVLPADEDQPFDGLATRNALGSSGGFVFEGRPVKVKRAGFTGGK